MTADLVFLLDVDNTLLDGDRFVAELRAENARRFLDENRCSTASTPSGSTEAVEVC